MYGDASGELSMNGVVMDGVNAVPVSTIETGLTSLDVALPERGVEYLFTTPRGDIQITAQSVFRDKIDQAVGLLAILAVLIALSLAYRIGRAIIARTSERTLAIVMILLGVASFISGVLPVFGIILLVWGIAKVIRSATQSTPAAAREVAH